MKNCENIDELFLKDLVDTLSERLEKSANYHVKKITSNIYEDLMLQVAEDLRKEYNCTDHTNSRKGGGKDIVFNNLRFSLKGCLIQKTSKKTKFSSYRLTEADSSSDSLKTEIGRRDATFDYYILAARTEHESKVDYQIILLPSEFFNIDDFEFQENFTKKGVRKWISNEVNGVRFEVKEDMSSQLWIYVDLTLNKTHRVLLKRTVSRGDNRKYDLVKI